MLESGMPFRRRMREAGGMDENGPAHETGGRMRRVGG
jgi:hypothetical protein